MQHTASNERPLLSSDDMAPMTQSAGDLLTREIRYETSENLASFFSEENLSLWVSTYQAGKIACFGAQDDELSLSFHNFDRPMGIAVSDNRQRIAVAAKNKVWFLRCATEVASSIAPAGKFRDAYVTQSAHVTGEIQAHEMCWSEDELWIVNTLFSCLCTVDRNHHFVPQWRPTFISELAPEDRCHLNGLAMQNGKPKYVTAMAETDTAGGWRVNKSESGCLIDVDTNQVVARGFAMPHSPRVHMKHVWLLDSGRGALVRVDPSDGSVVTVARFPGYARGLSFFGNYACVGLSKIRETSTFGGVPIAEDRDRLKCGACIVDLRTGKLAAQIEFKTGVDEIFDVSFLPTAGPVAVQGPFASEDGSEPVWIVPQPIQ